MQYIEYRKDLGHANVVSFKQRLTKLLKETATSVSQKNIILSLRRLETSKFQDCLKQLFKAIYILERLDKMQTSIDRLQMARSAVQRSASRRFVKLQTPVSEATLLDLIKAMRAKHPDLDVTAASQRPHKVISFNDDGLDVLATREAMMSIVDFEKISACNSLHVATYARFSTDLQSERSIEDHLFCAALMPPARTSQSRRSTKIAPCPAPPCSAAKAHGADAGPPGDAG